MPALRGETSIRRRRRRRRRQTMKLTDKKRGCAATAAVIGALILMQQAIAISVTTATAAATTTTEASQSASESSSPEDELFSQQQQETNNGNTEEDDRPANEKPETGNRQQQLPRENRHDGHDDKERRLFVIEVLRMLHEQYHGFRPAAASGVEELTKKEDRQSSSSELLARRSMMSQLMNAIGANGDMRRLIDWVQNSFNLASIGELTTQFVVSKLGSVNCAAILKPDSEDTLVPRFLLFNEHFVDVPYELPIKPSATECLANGRFDPQRKTVVLIHGYLTGYTLVDGLTNIKNRLLDLNNLVGERTMRVLERLQESSLYGNTTRLFIEDIEYKLKQQQYNVIIVDWFNGANPVPRSRYIRAAVNAQVVGKLIAKFLSQMVAQCRTSANNIQIIAHSLGCHVAGFTGKAMQSMGHRLGKITHLDPVGLCFGRLFSEPRFRLSPSDALDTQAIHVSLNLFDNPLDGAQSNILVNGGRDQIGCGGQSELKNSTTSSVSLLFDSETRFAPCSHLRALALYEDDLSSEPGQCQLVGYRCPTYDRFLAGKCGRCDSTNGQCKLMSLPPIIASFKTIPIQSGGGGGGGAAIHSPSFSKTKYHHHQSSDSTAAAANKSSISATELELRGLVGSVSNGSIAWLIDDKELNQKIVSTIARLKPDLVMEKPQQQQPSELEKPAGGGGQSRPQAIAAEHNNNNNGNNEIRRSDRRLTAELHHREKLVQTIEKIRADTRAALADGLHGFRSVGLSIGASEFELPKLKSLARSRVKQHAASGSAGQQQQQQQPQAPNLAQILAESELLAAASRTTGDPIPLGGQAAPAGSVNMPLYFVGTGPISPYCVNYYQFRMLIAESRLNRLLKAGALAPNKAPPLGAIGLGGSLMSTAAAAAAAINMQRGPTTQRDMLHFTVKLTDSEGHFFKGFSLIEDVRSLVRIPMDSQAHRQVSGSESMIELTMLLNTTKPEPVHISESIVSFYFHGIVLADSIEVNYMSNISPQVRARYSSVLCPLAINDRHQLVKYVECDKLAAR